MSIEFPIDEWQVALGLVYLDDVVLFSRRLDEHIELLNEH